MPIQFDGVTDAIDVGDLTSIEGASALTIAVWVYLDNITADHAIGSKGDTSAEFTGLWFDKAGKAQTDLFAFNVGDAVDEHNRVQAGTGSAAAGQWMHVAGVMDGSYRAIYVDGVLKDSHSNAPAITVPAADDNFLIGGSDLIAGFMVGRIDDLIVATTALSGDVIASLAKSRLRGLAHVLVPSGLQGYWPMDELRAGTAVPADAGYVRDLSGNGNHGTKVGDPAYAEGILASPAAAMYVPTVEAPPPTYQPYHTFGFPSAGRLKRGFPG